MAINDQNLGQFASALPPETTVQNKNGQWRISGYYQGAPREAAGSSLLQATQNWWNGIEQSAGVQAAPQPSAPGSNSQATQRAAQASTPAPAPQQPAPQQPDTQQPVTQ